MTPTVTLELPDELLKAIELAASKMSGGPSLIPIVVPSLIALLAALLASGLTAWVQARNTKQLLDHQRQLESEKQRNQENLERYGTIRKHLESAYQELLDLERWSQKLMADTGARTAAVNSALYPTEIGAIRMHLDLIDAADLLELFSAMDARQRDYFQAMIAITARMKPDPKYAMSLLATFEAFGKATDEMKGGIRRHLSPRPLQAVNSK